MGGGGEWALNSTSFFSSKGNLPVDVGTICAFGFGVVFSVWCYFVLKWGSAVVLGVAAKLSDRATKAFLAWLLGGCAKSRRTKLPFLHQATFLFNFSLTSVYCTPLYFLYFLIFLILHIIFIFIFSWIFVIFYLILFFLFYKHLFSFVLNNW